MDGRNHRSGMGIPFLGMSFPGMRYMGNPIEVFGSCGNVMKEKNDKFLFKRLVQPLEVREWNVFLSNFPKTPFNNYC